MKKTFLLSLSFLYAIQLLNAQIFDRYLLEAKQKADKGNIFPEVGKPCPDFSLNNIQYYSKKDVSLKDLKGKHVILDFFSAYCTGCFLAFPKVDSLQKEFGEKVQFILVAFDDGKYVRPWYEKYRKALHLDLPVVYDSNLCNRFVPGGYPHYIYIDPEGTVRAIPTSSPTREDIQDFINNKPLKLSDNSYAAQIRKAESFSKGLVDFDWKYAFDKNHQKILRNELYGNHLYTSEFGKWKDGMSWDFPSFINIKGCQDKYFIEGKATLEYLYKFAFFGRTYWDFFSGNDDDSVQSYIKTLQSDYYPFLVTEVADKSLFEKTSYSGYDYWYRLKLPAEIASTKNLMSAMQTDLKRFFGYEAGFENRIMPYKRIVVVDKAKAAMLQTKGGSHENNIVNFVKLKVNNIPWNYIINTIGYNFPKTFLNDETGITGNVDIDLDFVMNDIEGLRRNFQKLGLDIVEGKKEMKVLVIRDGKTF